MRSRPGKALAAAVVAATAAVALTACAAGHQPTATDTRTSSSAGQTLQQQAEADAAAILSSFAVPPGGHRLGGPPRLPGGVLGSPITYLGAVAEAHLTGFWTAPGNPQSLLTWEQAHLPARFTLGDADFGPPAWDRGFDLPPEGALITRELVVEVASTGNGQTGIRVDAWVAWQPPRSPASRIPPTATTVTIAESSNGGATASRLPAPVTITDPATVRRLAALIDGLPLSTIAPDASCPPVPGSFLTLTFRARAGGTAVAIAATDQPCGVVTLTIGGEQQPWLQNEPTLDARILTLAGLPWKLP